MPEQIAEATRGITACDTSEAEIDAIDGVIISTIHSYEHLQPARPTLEQGNPVVPNRTMWRFGERMEDRR